MMRSFLGWSALALLLVMAAYNLLVVAPEVTGGFLPQAAWWGYSTTELAVFGFEIAGRPDIARLYHLQLAVVDPLFILAFALWGGLSLRPLGRRWVLLPLAFTLADLGENFLLLGATGFGSSLADPILALPLADAPLAPAAWFTLAKLGLAAVILLSVWSRRAARIERSR
ncbi:hypothetical protein [Roseivivax sp.]